MAKRQEIKQREVAAYTDQEMIDVTKFVNEQFNDARTFNPGLSMDAFFINRDIIAGLIDERFPALSPGKIVRIMDDAFPQAEAEDGEEEADVGEGYYIEPAAAPGQAAMPAAPAAAVAARVGEEGDLAVALSRSEADARNAEAQKAAEEVALARILSLSLQESHGARKVAGDAGLAFALQQSAAEAASRVQSDQEQDMDLAGALYLSSLDS